MNKYLQITASRCGTLKYVPFEEGSWPPTENNLGGPYWERRLSEKGVHAPEYVALPHPAGAAAANMAVARISTGPSFYTQLPTMKVLFYVVGALCCCGLALAWCVGSSGKDGNGAGRRYVGPRKPRGRSKVLRRSTADASQEV